MDTFETMDWEQARSAASPIRFAVFVEEQNVPVEIELDDQDALSIHVLASVDGRTVGTGRLLPPEADLAGAAVDLAPTSNISIAAAGTGLTSHIGRMAVIKACRGQGIGARMLEVLVQRARERGDTRVVLSAQTHAIGFYRRYGFTEFGPIYLDAGIEHQSMHKFL